MSAFDKIKLGLEEAISFEKGSLPAKTAKLTIVPVEKYQADEIKRIRNSTGLTQRSFAEYMGVSQKTVEAWEAGRNHPEGAACRLLSLTKADPQFPQKAGIVDVAFSTACSACFMRMLTRSASVLLCRISSFCFLSAVCSARISANCALQASLSSASMASARSCWNCSSSCTKRLSMSARLMV